MARRKDENGQAGEFRLHGDLLSTTLLAYLRNWNAYGYQLLGCREDNQTPGEY